MGKIIFKNMWKNMKNILSYPKQNSSIDWRYSGENDERPWWLSGKASACQSRDIRHRGFDPWAKKVPWRRKWQPSPAFLPGKPYAKRSLAGLHSTGSQKVGHNLATEQQKFVSRIFSFVLFDLGFPHSTVGKESTCNAGDHSSIPGSGRSAGEGIGYHSSILGLPLWLSW